MFRAINQLCFTLFIALICNASLQAQVINTIAGTGAGVSSGDGGLAINASLDFPQGVALDGQGNIYFTEDFRVRKINVQTGIITTIAGTGASGFSGDGGPAVQATFLFLIDLAIDASGNIFVSDRDNNRIRRIDAVTGIVTTVAGGGVGLNEGGLATSASLPEPTGIAIDQSGNIYVALEFQHRVRKISNTGIITTIAGTGVAGYNGDNIPATTAQVNWPGDVAVDGNGNLYIADTDNNRIRKIGSNGIIQTFAGNGGQGIYPFTASLLSSMLPYPRRLQIDGAGKMYIAGMTSSCLQLADLNTGLVSRYAGSPNWGFSGDGGYAELAGMTNARGVAVDALGNVYFSDAGNNRIRKITNNCLRPVQPGYINTTNTGSNCSAYQLDIPAVNNATSYTWSTPPGWTGSSTTNLINIARTSNIASNGTVSVYASNSCGAGLPYVAESMLPHFSDTITPSGPTTICQGEQLTLHSKPYQLIYEWYHNGMPINGAIDSIYTPTQSGTYFVVTNTYYGCLDTLDAVTVTINPAPNAMVSTTIPWPYHICAGDSVTFTGNVDSGITYQWKINNQIIPGANTPNYTADSEAYFTLVETLGPCSDNFTVDLSVDPVPYPDVLINGGYDDLCVGNAVLYTVSSWSLTYQWQLNGVDIPGANSDHYQTNVAGTYRVNKAYVTTGCSSYSHPYNVSYLPVTSSIVAVTPTTICENAWAQLQANSGNNLTYQWKLNGVDIPGAITQNYFTPQPGDYSVVVINGVCADSSAAPITINTIPAPNPVIAQSGNVLSVPAVYNTYQWYRNGFVINGATTNEHIATADGGYHVDVNDGTCDGQSNTLGFALNVGNITGNEDGVSVYPNPFSVSTTLNFINPLHKSYTFNLYNTQGKIIQRVTDITTEHLLIKRGDLPSGFYYYSLSCNEQGVLATGKLTIE